MDIFPHSSLIIQKGGDFIYSLTGKRYVVFFR